MRLRPTSISPAHVYVPHSFINIHWSLQSAQLSLQLSILRQSIVSVSFACFSPVVAVYLNSHRAIENVLFYGIVISSLRSPHTLTNVQIYNVQ